MVATTADGSTLPGLPGTMTRLGKDLGLDADRESAPPRPAALADIDARQKRKSTKPSPSRKRLLGPSADRRRENVSGPSSI